MFPVYRCSVYIEHTPGVCLLLGSALRREYQRLGEASNACRQLRGPTGLLLPSNGTHSAWVNCLPASTPGEL